MTTHRIYFYDCQGNIVSSFLSYDSPESTIALAKRILENDEGPYRVAIIDTGTRKTVWQQTKSPDQTSVSPNTQPTR
jgi:hypothetical protein